MISRRPESALRIFSIFVDCYRRGDQHERSCCFAISRAGFGVAIRASLTRLPAGARLSKLREKELKSKTWYALMLDGIRLSSGDDVSSTHKLKAVVVAVFSVFSATPARSDRPTTGSFPCRPCPWMQRTAGAFALWLLERLLGIRRKTGREGISSALSSSVQRVWSSNSVRSSSMAFHSVGGVDSPSRISSWERKRFCHCLASSADSH